MLIELCELLTPSKLVCCLLAAVQNHICVDVSAAAQMHQLRCTSACLNFTSLPCSGSWSPVHTDTHDSSCLAGPGDGDCGFQALLVAMLLQVCCCGPARGASLAARTLALFNVLSDWTPSHAVIAGYHTLKVSRVHKAHRMA